MARSETRTRKLPQSYELEFSPSGRFLVALGTRVARWDVEDGGTGSSIAISTDGDEVACVESGRVTFRSGTDLQERRRIEIESPSSVRYSPDGTHIAIGAWGSGLLVPRTETQS